MAQDFFRSVICVSGLLLASTTATLADSTYVETRVGFNFLKDMDNGGDLVNYEINGDTGFMIEGATGYIFEDANYLRGLSLDASIGYSRHNVDEMTFDTDGGLGVALGVGSLDGMTLGGMDGFVEAWSLFAGTVYEPPLTEFVHPYAGFGLGLSRVKADVSSDALIGMGAAEAEIINDHDFGFSYKVRAGLRLYQFAGGILSVEYQYNATNDLNMTTVVGSQFDPDHKSHSILAGFRINY